MLIIGDLHLDGMRLFVGEHGTQLQLKSLDRILNTHQQDTDTVIFLGDIFHRPTVPYATLFDFCLTLKRYSYQYLAITGNHDQFSRQKHAVNPVVRLCNILNIDFQVFDTPEKRIVHGIPCTFLPYGFKTPFKGTKVVFAHDDIKGATYDNGMAVLRGIDPTNFRWVSGHIHTRQKVGNSIFYPGTPYPTKFSEQGKKGYILWVDQFKWIESIPAFSLEQRPCTSAKDIADIPETTLEAWVEQDTPVFYRLGLPRATMYKPSYDWMVAHPQVSLTTEPRHTYTEPVRGKARTAEPVKLSYRELLVSTMEQQNISADQQKICLKILNKLANIP